jgi:hypothetical protein
MMRRASARSATAPVATICIATLPSAVASAGPAMTRRPVASAVNWFSSRLREPPPTIWISVIRVPVSSSSASSTTRYLNARLSRIARVSTPALARLDQSGRSVVDRLRVSGCRNAAASDRTTR